MNKISESDIAEFHEKGFLLVKYCFSELEINQAGGGNLINTLKD